MQFLKKHYDKIILSVVLLALAVVAVMLPFEVSAFEKELEAIRLGDQQKPPAAFEPADMSTNKALLARYAAPKPLVLSGEHNLLNPRTWTRRPDGSLAKSQFGAEVGLDALRVTKIDPLKVSVDYVGIDPSTTSSPIYVFRVTNPEGRPAVTTQKVQIGSRNPMLVLLRIEGFSNSPTSFSLTLKLATKTDQNIMVAPNRPFENVTGYSADLFYPPNQRIAARKRGDDLPRLAGLTGENETYTVVGVSPTDVTIAAKSTGMRRTIPLNAPLGSGNPP